MAVSRFLLIVVLLAVRPAWAGAGAGAGAAVAPHHTAKVVVPARVVSDKSAKIPQQVAHGGNRSVPANPLAYKTDRGSAAIGGTSYRVPTSALNGTAAGNGKKKGN